MVASTIEKPQHKKSFVDLIHLREELTKESKNQDRLAKFQKTIDKALEKGERKGVIEFSESEWKSLIADEDLPPFAEVQKLLKEKIAGAKEVNLETKEKTGGIMDELQKKTQNLTEGVKKKVEELAAKAEGLKKYSKPALWFLGIGLSLKIWGYKIANWFSGLFGKKGEYDEKLKLAEMEKDFLKNPEEAVKKYGEEALGKVKEKVDEKTEEGAKEEKEGVLEKVGPLAALGVAGAGIFGLIKGKLPEGMQKSLSGLDQKSLLGKLARNRALRLFGIGGVALFGIGKLYEYIENNSATLGDIPTDTEGKKVWWKNALEKAGIGAKEGSEEIWAVLSGEKVEKYFDEKGPKLGYQFLSESELLKSAKTKIAILANKLELIYKKDPKKFDAAFSGIGLFKPGLIIGSIGVGIKGKDLLKNVVRALYGSAKNHPLLWSLQIALLGSEVEAVKHIQVKEGMTLDELSETIGDMASVDHIRDSLDGMAPGFMNDSFIKTAEYLENNCEKLSAQIEYIYTHWQEKLDAGLRNLLMTEDREKISNADKIGLEAFQKELQGAVLEKKTENPETLLGKDNKSGLLGELIAKCVREEPIIESDIHKLIAGTQGTNIRIFPEGGIQDGRTIQWVFVDKNGNPEGTAENICINPLQPEDKKVELSNNFIYDPHDLGFTSKFLHEGWNTMRDLVSQVTESATSEPGKAKSGIEKILGLGASIGCFGGKMFIEYLNQVYIIGPANILSSIIPGGKELSGQEFLVEYAGGMVPVLLINTTKRGLGKGGGLLGEGFGKLGWKVLAETALYPIKLPADIGKFIYTKYMHGDLGHIFESPGLFIREGFAESMRNVGLMPQSVRDFGNLVHQKEKLHQIHEKLKKINILKGLGSGMEKKAQKMMDEVFDTMRREGLLSRFPGRKLDSINIHESEKLLTETKAAIDKIHLDVETNSSKTLQELKEKLAREPASLNPRTDIPKTKAELEKMRDLCKEKIDALEVEKQRALSRNASGQISPDEFRKFMADSARRTSSLRGYTRSLDAHINARIGESGKWKKVGKGVIGIAALVGIMIGVQKIRADEPGKEIPELDGGEGEVNFYGYRDEEQIEHKEAKVGEDKKKENIKDSPEYIQPFLTSLAHIKGMYGTEFDFISDPKALKESTDDVIMGRVNNLCKIHSQMIVEIKKLVKENRDPLKKYLKTLKEKNLYVGEANINAFFGIKEKNGEILLEYMDDDDFSDTIWEMADFNRDNADEILAGNYDGWDQAWYITKRAAPVSGTYMDGADMVKNFQRGKTGDAFKSMGWMTLGVLCDVGMFFSFGGTGAGKAAINGSRAAIRWARMGKVIEAMRTVKNIMGTTKMGTSFAKTMSLAITHSGSLNILGVGTDIARQSIVFPRSESINIDKL